MDVRIPTSPDPISNTSDSQAFQHYGFWFAWGSAVWLPVTYTLQMQYLAHTGPDFSATGATLTVLLGLAGYAPFRSFNHQHYKFRQTHGACLIFGRAPKYLVAPFRLADGKMNESLLLYSGTSLALQHPRPAQILSRCANVYARGQAGGARRDIQITRRISSWRLPCVRHVACSTSSRGHTPSPRRQSWCTGASETRSAARRNIALCGTSTVSWCRGVCCRASFE